MINQPNPEKVSIPGRKSIRIINTVNNKSEGDYITLGTKIRKRRPVENVPSVHTYISKFVTTLKRRSSHKDIFVNGKLVYEKPDLKEIQNYAKENLKLLWEGTSAH